MLEKLKNSSLKFLFNKSLYCFIILLLSIILGVFNYYWFINAHNTLDKNWSLHVTDAARIIALHEDRLKLGIEREELLLSSFSELIFNKKAEFESVGLNFNVGKEGILEIILGEEPIQHSIKISNYGNIESGYFKIVDGKYHRQAFPLKLNFRISRWNNLNLKILAEYLDLTINKEAYQIKCRKPLTLTSLRIRSGPETIAIDNITIRLKDGGIFQDRFESGFKKTGVALINIFLSCIILFIIWLIELKILSKINLLNKMTLNLSLISYLPIMLLSLVFFFNVRNDILIVLVFLLVMFLKSAFLIKYKKIVILRDKSIYPVHLKPTQRAKDYLRYILSIDGLIYISLLLIYATILFFYLHFKNGSDVLTKLTDMAPGLEGIKEILPLFSYSVVPLSLGYFFILSALSNIRPKYILPYICFALVPLIGVVGLPLILGHIPGFNNFFLLVFMIIVALLLHFLYVFINSVYIRYNKVICFMLLISAFAATEIFSRTADFNRLWRPKWKITKRTEVLTSDDDLLWSPAIRVNAEGKIFLKDGEYPYSLEKLANTLRIISLGDSTTWGQGLKKLEDTYPGILNIMLNQNVTTQKFEVLNFGVPGYSSFQGLLLLKKHILKLAPDIVTIRFYANDVSDNLKIGNTLTDREYWMKLKNEKNKSNWLAFLQNKFPKCKIISDIKKIALNLKAKLNLFKPRKRVPLNEYIQNLKEIVKIAKENNIKVFFIYETLATGYPLNDMINKNLYFQALKLVSKDENIKLIDPITPFVERRHEALFFDEIHPTALGHRIIAEQILNTLKEEGII